MEISIWIIGGILALLLAFLVLLVVSEINKPVVTSGRIVRKYHDPAYEWYSFMPLMVGKVIIMIPIYHFDDEDWVLVLEGTDQHGEQSDGELYVSRKTWNKVKVGQHYTIGAGDSTYDTDQEIEVDEIPDNADVQE
jgi:hypothetical protein